MHELDFDASSLRDWMAGVGLLRLVSATTDTGRLVWRLVRGRHRLIVADAPADLAQRCSLWIAENRKAWAFDGRQNIDFDAEYWRKRVASPNDLEVTLWCALASDAVWHRSGKKLKATGLEFAHGGGHQHFLASLAEFVNSGSSTEEHISRLLAGQRDETMSGRICRWDPACERDHALRAKAPTKDRMTQDQTINALAAIGLASCPCAPGVSGLVSPIARARGQLLWPVWTDPLRIADLEAALCCGWSWPTMQGRRWLSGKLYCFSRGELREPEASDKAA